MTGLRRKRETCLIEESKNDEENFFIHDIQVVRENFPFSSEFLLLSPQYCLQTSIEDQAFCFFFKNFVLSPCKGNSRSYMSFVIPVIEQEKKGLSQQSILGASVKAVSLALLGNRPNSRSIRPRAMKQYSNALKEVNSALASQDLVLEDQTLAAVIVLGTFEVLWYNSCV